MTIEQANRAAARSAELAQFWAGVLGVVCLVLIAVIGWWLIADRADRRRRREPRELPYDVMADLVLDGRRRGAR